MARRTTKPTGTDVDDDVVGAESETVLAEKPREERERRERTKGSGSGRGSADKSAGKSAGKSADKTATTESMTVGPRPTPASTGDPEDVAGAEADTVLAQDRDAPHGASLSDHSAGGATLERSIIQQGPSQWAARADSIAGIEAALSRIWASEAQVAAKAGLSPGEMAEALGDPRLSGRLDQHEDVRVRTRTSVLTLVVVAARPETEERAVTAINHLAGRHPSRAIILSPGDPDGPASMDAHINAYCHLAETSSSETCTEEILLRVGGEIAQHLSGVVAPLLIHDLPVVLWWPDDPPIGSRVFRDLIDTCDRLLVDSGSFRDDGTKRLMGLAAVTSEGRPVTADIGWMRLTLWRELLAGLFDHPLLTGELGSVRTLRIDIAHPGAVLRLPKAACFAGWLAAMLGWEVSQPMERRKGAESLTGAFRRGRQEIKVEFRPVTGGVKIRSAGSLMRVEMELGRGRNELRARVTRQADHLLATADWNGAQVTRRAGRLEPFDETPFLAEALDRSAPDPVFAAALARATRLIG